MSDNFDDAKVGDKVFWDGSYHGIGICPITKVTPTQIVIRRGDSYDCRYWKKNGARVGGHSWGRDWIRKITPELIEQFELKKLSAKANDLRQKLGTPSTREGLEKFIAAIEPLIGLK